MKRGKPKKNIFDEEIKFSADNKENSTLEVDD